MFFGGNTYPDYSSFASATGATLECVEITCHISTITITQTDGQPPVSFTYDVFGNTITVDLECINNKAQLVEVKPDCETTFDKSARCLLNPYTDGDGNIYPSGSVFVVVTALDCTGKLLWEKLYDSQSILSGNPIQVVLTVTNGVPEDSYI